MSERFEQDDERPDETEAANPTSEELDLEGPNESAPGHEPAENSPDESGGRPSEGGE